MSKNKRKKTLTIIFEQRSMEGRTNNFRTMD